MGGLNDLVGWLLGWSWDHRLRKKWKGRNRAAGCFSKEDRLGKCHPLGYGVMKRNYLHPLAKAFKGQVIYTKGSFRQRVGWNIKEGRWKKESNPISVYRSGQRSFNSRPAWTYSKAALKEGQRAAYRSDQRSFNSRSALETPRENRDKIDKETSKQQTPKFIHQPVGNNIHYAG